MSSEWVPCSSIPVDDFRPHVNDFEEPLKTGHSPLEAFGEVDQLVNRIQKNIYKKDIGHEIRCSYLSLTEKDSA